MVRFVQNALLALLATETVIGFVPIALPPPKSISQDISSLDMAKKKKKKKGGGDKPSMAEIMKDRSVVKGVTAVAVLDVEDDNSQEKEEEDAAARAAEKAAAEEALRLKAKEEEERIAAEKAAAEEALRLKAKEERIAAEKAAAEQALRLKAEEERIAAEKTLKNTYSLSQPKVNFFVKSCISGASLHRFDRRYNLVSLLPLFHANLKLSDNCICLRL